MSAPLDVLADVIRYELKAGGTAEWLAELREARAAVAELVEAAGRMADAADMDERMTARASLRAALAKFGGAA